MHEWILCVIKNYLQCGPLKYNSSDLRDKSYQLLFDIYTGIYVTKKTKCKAPCTELEYQVFHRGTDVRKGGYAMYLVFDQVVDVSRSQLVVDGLTLLNRLGGTIGFCKELLWSVCLLGTATKLAMNVLKIH